MFERGESIITEAVLPCWCDAAYSSRGLSAPDCPRCQCGVDVIDAVDTALREVRIATLVEAAQRVCGYCFREDYDLIRDGTLLRHEAHKPPGYGLGGCHARAIVEMLVEMWA